MRLPIPAGPHPIGTVTYHWVDRARDDLFFEDGRPRELIVQVWYPAARDADGERAPYVDDGTLLRPLARLFPLPEDAFDGLDRVRTHGVRGAPLADDEARYPVLVFSHGRCGFRGHNTVQVEHLASHGFVVAAIDHPSAATGVRFPDGRRVMFDPRLLPPWPLELLPGHDGEVQRATLSYLAADARFVLDRLSDLDRGEPDGPFAGRLDPDRMAAFGVSLGAMTLALATLDDSRIRALLVMDAPMPPRVAAGGLRIPVMWQSRDAATMTAEGWDPRDVETTQRTMREGFERLPGDGYLVLVPGMYHPDFSDARLLSPLLAERGYTGPIDGDRALAIVNAYSLAFFDRHLRGRDAPLLQDPSNGFPEVVFEMRSPAASS